MSNKSASIKELAAALARAQAQLEGAVKDSENPFFKSNYADLQSVWDACRKPLNSNGLSVVQTMDATEKGAVLVTTLMHSSGEWIEGRLPINPAKNDPQGMGSAITYARRYALAAIVGVYQTDDDAESAMERPQPQQPSRSGSPAPTAPQNNGPAPDRSQGQARAPFAVRGVTNGAQGWNK